MDDQYRNGNDSNSVPAYQVLDDLDAAGELDVNRTMMPFDDIPQMEPMNQGYPQPDNPYAQPQAGPMNYPSGQQGAPMQMGYAQPQQYNYAGPGAMPQQTQLPVPQQYGYPQPMQPQYSQNATKFCKFCAAKIPSDAVICTACGRQVEALNQGQAPIVINNTNDNVVNAPVNVSNQVNAVMVGAKPKDKWVAFILCFFLGVLGIHKFYEGKVGLGILYLFTGGLCGIGWLVDMIMILLKPNPYYV